MTKKVKPLDLISPLPVPPREKIRRAICRAFSTPGSPWEGTQHRRKPRRNTQRFKPRKRRFANRLTTYWGTFPAPSASCCRSSGDTAICRKNPRRWAPGAVCRNLKVTAAWRLNRKLLVHRSNRALDRPDSSSYPRTTSHSTWTPFIPISSITITTFNYLVDAGVYGVLHKMETIDRSRGDALAFAGNGGKDFIAGG